MGNFGCYLVLGDAVLFPDVQVNVELFCATHGINVAMVIMLLSCADSACSSAQTSPNSTSSFRVAN